MVIILTTPRPQNMFYFAETYEEVRRQLGNDAQLAVVVDGDRTLLATKSTMLYLKKSRPGNRDAFFSALAFAAIDGEDLLFLEDDLALCKNAVPYMLYYPVPADVGFVSFFTPGPQRVGTKIGLHVGAPGTNRFNQALKFPWKTLCRLNDWHNNTTNDECEADVALADACRELNITWGHHVPDLCEHVGDVSVYQDGRSLPWWRRASTFPGVDFDALKLRNA